MPRSVIWSGKEVVVDLNFVVLAMWSTNTDDEEHEVRKLVVYLNGDESPFHLDEEDGLAMLDAWRAACG